MAYITSINNQSFTVNTVEDGQPRRILLEGTEYTIDWQQIASLAADAKGNSNPGGHYSLINNGKSYDIFARRITKPDEKDSQTYEISIAGQRFEVKVEDEHTRLLTGLARGGAQTSEARIQAPMPGLVVGVPVEPDMQVTQGQTVVVLEAMKMENDLASPISGIIKEVRVNKGQTVEQNQVLVVITAE